MSEQPENRLLPEWEITFYLSASLAMMSDIQGHELKKRELERTGECKRTAKDLKKLKRLKEIEGLLVKLADLYLPEGGWAVEDLEKADKVVAEVNAAIERMYQ